MDYEEEVAVLKKQVKALKREVARLKKMLQQDLPVKEEKAAAEPEHNPEPVFLCPLCGSDKIGHHTTPSGKQVRACKSCKKYRKAME